MEVSFLNSKKKKICFLLILIFAFNAIIIPSKVYASANLAWGPVDIGNLRFKMTNPHNGWAGPKFPNANHVNFHVEKKSGRSYKSVANYHIVKYSSGSSNCMYIYESHSRSVVLDQCFNSWRSAVTESAKAMKAFSKTLLDNANWIATIAIWGTIGLVLLDLVLPMDPIPIIPFSSPEEKLAC